MLQSSDYNYCMYLEEGNVVHKMPFVDVLPPPTEFVYEDNGRKFFYRIERGEIAAEELAGHIYNYINVGGVMTRLISILVTDTPKGTLRTAGVDYEYIYIREEQHVFLKL